MLRSHDKIRTIRVPAMRFYVREPDDNRSYYMLEISSSPLSERDHEWVKLIAGDAIDYIGHGSRDRLLIETFIEEVLRLPIEDRLASDLILELIEIKRGGGGGPF